MYDRLASLSHWEEEFHLEQKVLKYTTVKKLEMLFVGLLASIKAVSYTATTLRVDAARTTADRATWFDDQSVLADTLDAARDAVRAWFHVSGGSS